MAVVLLATANRHKVEEIRSILGPDFEFLTLADFPNAPAVVEDAPDFTGNATKKAVELAEWLVATPRKRKVEHVLADDSGLEVDALNQAPGVHSARFAALDSGQPGNSPDLQNNEKLLRLLRDTPSERRTARFRCVIAFVPVPPAEADPASPVCYASEAEMQAEIFEGACEGSILSAPRGTSGFGYDPLFVPRGYSESFGELSEEKKNSMSHRAEALRRLRAWWQARK